MKLGILGTGMIVKDLLQTLHLIDIEAIDILGTKKTNEETQALVDQYHLRQAYFDYDELLNSDVDTIYIASPNYLHYRFARKALEHHKHVIIEKPITANSDELKDLITLAKHNNLIILEAMNIHYLPAYQAIKESIKTIGQPKIISLNYSQYSSRYDAFKQGQILPAFDYHKAGGALMDLNVYNLHFIIGLFDKPQDIHYYPNIKNNIDTSGILVLDYPNFQVVSVGAKDCKAPVMCTLQGDLGHITIHTPVNQLQTYHLESNSGDNQDFDFNEDKHRLYYEFKEFNRIINERDYTKANEMLNISLTVSELMYQARRDNHIIFDNDGGQTDEI